MSEKKTSSLEKIGYIKTLPKDADINDYENLLITEKDGKKITLYRLLSEREEFDDTGNFSNSWNVFNSYLNS
ncbi:MAG: hypothetical protein VX762_03760 [Bacteroidota bacterium]|nr:hypothetical protein [Bacteroidota bacterium]